MTCECVCEIICAAIYRVDPIKCECVPLDINSEVIEIIGKTKNYTPGKGPIGPAKID